ncbi:TetR/AcrR family transcriptional regulator (plasmid) [Nocardioides sp. R1-1]|uniref:TetR/AcrR family transcriptional regulator n=1 Tax=Nocardioides sp. R1-1 TaxID=3383502 RepID=UPI0038D00415
MTSQESLHQRSSARPRKATATQDSFARLRAAAVTLFARQGYVATGIRDIAREADLSTATLYHYVSNKEELLVAIMREAFESLIGNAMAATAGLRAPQEMLAALVRQHVLTETGNQTVANVATVEFRFLGPEARAEVVPLRDQYEAIWHGVLSKGISSKAFRVENPTVMRLALLQLCSGPEEWYRPDGNLTPEEIAEQYVELALRLVGARKSRSAS